MLDRRKANRLVGESLREVGILLLVFGPLDALFQRAQAGVLAVTPFIAVGLLLVGVGIIIEARE